MEIRTAYCSACDRDVKVYVRPELLSGPGAPPPDPGALICLDFGERCTGDMCPLFQLPTDGMRANLERLAGHPELLP